MNMTEPDDTGPMPYGEKHTWAYLTTAVTVPVVYTVYMLTRLAETPAADIAFQRPLIIAVIASIVMNMFVAPMPRKGIDRRDQRDTDINRRGEHIGFFVLAFAMLGPFALAMTEADHFWIANAMYLVYVLNAVTSSTVKLVLYHRGW